MDTPRLDGPGAGWVGLALVTGVSEVDGGVFGATDADEGPACEDEGGGFVVPPPPPATSTSGMAAARQVPTAVMMAAIICPL